MKTMFILEYSEDGVYQTVFKSLKSVLEDIVSQSNYNPTELECFYESEFEQFPLDLKNLKKLHKRYIDGNRYLRVWVNCKGGSKILITECNIK